MEIIQKINVLDKNFTIYGTIQEPLLLAKDVSEWMGYSSVSNFSRVVKTIDDNEKIILTNPNTGKLATFLTEKGVYQCLIKSTKPLVQCIKIEFENILHRLRTEGGYIIEEIKTKKEKRAIYQKEYYQQNKEKISSYHKEYNEKNKEKISSYHKEYYQNNKEKIISYQKEYNQNNKEKISIRNKKNYQKNKRNKK